MIVNSLLHFFLNVLGAKRQEDRNDWGPGAEGGGVQMTSGAQQQGLKRLSGDKTRGGVVLGRKDLDSHSLPRYGGQIFHFMSTK